MPTESRQWRPPYRAVRESQGLSLREVAGRTDIDPAHLSRIERGLAQPTLPVVHRLAKTLGLTKLEKLLRTYTEPES